MPDSTFADAPPAIEVRSVFKSFNGVTALAGIDLDVQSGSLAALLGPNGAGKTTLVRIIATLARADRGQVRVLGHDVAGEPAQVRSRIGLTGQFAGLDEGLTGRDNLVLIGRLAGLRRREAVTRAAELAGEFRLAEAISRTVKTYSGGMRRRLDLAASLVTRPALLVLDEPTTGLDPGGRQQLWAVLAGLRAAGTTMQLTTQYLEEADLFADTVHVLDHGRIVASGAPARLKSRVAAAVVDIRLDDATRVPAAVGVLAARLRLPATQVRADTANGRLTLPAGEGTGTLLAAAAALDEAHIAVVGVSVRQPSLDEVFLALTDQVGVAA